MLSLIDKEKLVQKTEFLLDDVMNVNEAIEFNLDGKAVRISPRELLTIKYIYEGYTAKEVAKLMEISFRTVEKHLANVKQKMQCRTKMEMISKLIFLLMNNRLCSHEQPI